MMLQKSLFAAQKDRANMGNAGYVYQTCRGLNYFFSSKFQVEPNSKLRNSCLLDFKAL